MMADYPDWVLKHKSKGTYINKSGNNYYLYSAHSERVKGTKKVKRVFDEYLGRITEQEGLIPPKDKVKDSVIVYEYGLSFTTLSVCRKIHLALRRSYVKYGDCIMAASILNYIYGMHSVELFERSYLSLHFPGIAFPNEFNEAQMLGIERGTRMIADTMYQTFSSDLALIRIHFPLLSLARINDRLHLSQTCQTVADLADKYSITWEDSLWQK